LVDPELERDRPRARKVGVGSSSRDHRIVGQSF